MVRSGNSSQHSSSLVIHGQGLARVEFGAAIRKLDDDRRVGGFRGLHDRIDAVAANHVDRRQCVAVLLGVSPNVGNLRTCEDSCRKLTHVVVDFARKITSYNNALLITWPSMPNSVQQEPPPGLQDEEP